MGENSLKPINRLLIANRGEIACRVIRTAKRLGIHTIAVYAKEDQHALHTTLADEAFCIGSAPLENSYLNIDHIISAAKESRADAIHPGYGFLSENAHFAKRCQQENIIFIGPSPNAIAKMAVKDEAKRIMQSAGVPVVPGYQGTSQSVKDLETAARDIGFPLMLKAAKGGGGKGMRIVKQPAELIDAIESAKRESLASFSDDSLFIEKYLTDARHIEIQVFRDSHGNAVHLYERDCSLQRRHQKIIEESPALHINEDIKQQLYNAAINAAHAIDYLGAGTIEFLYASNEFYFMEMNTRLQVEHPVTEMITGLDLVEWQIRLAEGEAIPARQQDIHCHGHAIEARIYAEDPCNHFLPATGYIKDAFLPQGLNYRLDSGIQVGDKISIHFDPMLAKLIVHAQNREEARKALLSALAQYHLVGITTNIAFLRNVLLSDDFIEGRIHTQTLEKSLTTLLPKAVKPTLEQLAIAGTIKVLTRRHQAILTEGDPYSPWNRKDAWRLNDDFKESFDLFFQGVRYPLTLTYLPERDENTIHCQIACSLFSTTLSMTGHLKLGKLEITLANHQTIIPYYRDETSIEFLFLDQALSFQLEDSQQEYATSMGDSHQAIRAPMPGIITKIWVKAGDKVSNGSKLLALEAMKMEHTLAAPKSAAIKAIRYDIGDQVEEGCELIDFE
ncbi:MAG: acetyl-CoA carboxylase biotin carboxylase subunit [Candidatus Berkiella sp.]